MAVRIGYAVLNAAADAPLSQISMLVIAADEKVNCKRFNRAPAIWRSGLAPQIIRKRVRNEAVPYCALR